MFMQLKWLFTIKESSVHTDSKHLMNNPPLPHKKRLKKRKAPTLTGLLISMETHKSCLDGCFRAKRLVAKVDS